MPSAPKVNIRIKASDGRAWGGLVSDPAKYAQQLADQLHLQISYAIEGIGGQYQPWQDVFPNKGLPDIGEVV